MHILEFGLILTADFQGIWSGMIGGTAVQTIILAYLTVKCDWDEEVAHCTLIFFASSVSAYICLSFDLPRVLTASICLLVVMLLYLQARLASMRMQKWADDLK